jgi:hypothetical protein
MCIVMPRKPCMVRQGYELMRVDKREFAQDRRKGREGVVLGV